MAQVMCGEILRFSRLRNPFFLRSWRDEVLINDVGQEREEIDLVLRARLRLEFA